MGWSKKYRIPKVRVRYHNDDSRVVATNLGKNFCVCTIRARKKSFQAQNGNKTGLNRAKRAQKMIYRLLRLRIRSLQPSSETTVRVNMAAPFEFRCGWSQYSVLS